MKATTATTVTTTSTNVTAADVLRTLGKCITIIAIYVLQRMAEGLCLAQRLTLRTIQWLNARHNITDKEDPVVMTGWQYVGFTLLICVVSLAMSVRW